MGQFLILSDSTVHDILIDLRKDQILHIRDALVQCLTEFSTGSEREYQPPVGIVNRPEGNKTLFRPFTSASSVGVKVIVDPPPSSPAAGALHGILAICDLNGIPTGMLNAEEITGYRTALSALVPFLWRRCVENIVVFGAGRQALWHLRLALALRGDEIKSITILNRSAQRAQGLLAEILQENEKHWGSPARMKYLDPSYVGYKSEMSTHLGTADAIFCTVGTTAPVFSAESVLDAKRRRLPYISAVGSWQQNMLELDPNLLRRVRKPENGYRLDEQVGGSVLVDDRIGALEHSGEIVQSELDASDIIEIGQIEQLRSSENSKQLHEWLEDGLLVYKSIGVSTTDLAAGRAVLALATAKGVGVQLDNF
ncbi:hypothetical protein PFICI_13202 [Pestalotiopsis fici W106-1]|uniref:Quinate/shikimate 5-dehydrogenase/glutamyl-tRNA reductase domain-containing protein n=1 Tax=Pestalotiopsis fici (strain W106-1 / CGMCC3.15140) TaxID=1229662 RepID=W3WLI8_PESFW|nr:uncharacterized protein PFICI_13202 [Pestalotiopsis fici W106-1]ETS74718.1 hypothetical protein PFICI_13202 [Pestalotiopsis fici W106-1]